MSDALIDPVSHGYVLTQGAVQRDPAGGLANAVYLRLEIPLGSYWADKTMGSQLHLLQRMKDLARVERLAKAYAEQALDPLLADGRAKSIEVSTQRIKAPDGGGRLNLLIEVTDAGGRQRLFVYPVKVI